MPPRTSPPTPLRRAAPGRPARALPALVAALATSTLAAGALVACGAPRSPRAAQPTPGTTYSIDTTQTRGQNVARVEELFAGRFPGVQAYAASGGMIVRIRGTNSFMGSGQPLFVIDGVMTNVGADGLVAINPSDVARIEVLKDAADLAMYGSRSGNGVVRITTKRPGRR